MRLLVGGVGYGCLRDLSFGPIVIECLRAREWPAGMEVEDLSYNPVAVTQKLQEERFDKVIVIGATERGRVLGHLYRFPYDGALPPPEEIQQRVGEAVTGVISVDNLLTVCAQFHVLPPVVEVIELEPVDEGWGEGLTPEAAARVEEVAAMIREEARLVELEREVRRIPGCGCDCHESSPEPCDCGCECCAPTE
jgi:hydrogenase maturation protease